MLTYAIKRFLYKTFARTATFVNRYYHAKSQPTRVRMLRKVWMKIILVTEIAMM
jgi:hypothetical protein